LLIVLSGPSGSGKDAVLNRMKQRAGRPLTYITTVTTRPQRAEEKDQIDYHFVSSSEFQDMLARNALLESANVYGNWYGVPRQPVKQSLDNGQDVIVKVDIQGAATIKQLVPQAVFIFLMLPSMEELTQRLTQRNTETPFDLALRLNTATDEIEQLSQYDYVVYNHEGEIDRAAAEIEAIITADKCRVAPREVSL